MESPRPPADPARSAAPAPSPLPPPYQGPIPAAMPLPQEAPSEPEPLVRLDGVGHRFGTNDALRDLSFEVPDGRITVLLGPNGAGKTTAIRAITGALAPMWGTVRTFGLDPDDDGHLVRPRCGVVSAKPALYDRLTGRDNLAYSAELYGVGDAAADRIEDAAARFGISDALDQMVGGYSTGMKTRLALARSVLHDPQLLLYDEPTSGLDPESSYAVLDLIREMTSYGHTVVMCTHLLAEAEGLADHIVMMEAGTDLISGSPDELTRRYWPHPIVTLDAVDPRLLDRAASFPGVAGYRRDPSGARLEVDDLRRVPDMVASLTADGVRLTRVEPHVPTLEDLYFTIRREAGIVAGIGGVSGDGADAEHSGGPIVPRERGLAPVTTGHGQLPSLGDGSAAPDRTVPPAGRPATTDQPMTGAPR
ncbi:ABC transporter ATP-binding protein [Dermatobacter hominis]|uniref:ABC transporter ATP-binding protein n=1 Tax=Dermatobacter hominis TaxID=2884263 RepID=UPI001D0FDB76|nr:ABC transporter ATP-binding protein [Dermatobacter hominis]UDY36155.1 ABC transporter ATP-binding protein [Dermatobacter hominis]